MKIKSGDLNIKKAGALIGNFEKNPQEMARSCFVGQFFLLKYTTKAPTVNLLRLKMLRGNKTAYMGMPPPPFPTLPEKLSGFHWTY